MMFPRLTLAFLLGLVATLAPTTARAAAPARVTATLVAADTSVQPGTPLTVALRLEHAPKWHTYWLNPGTGLPTSLTWKLPPGWTAGPIQWPAPRILHDSKANVVGQGYEGDLLLPVTLTPPRDAAPGGTVTLRAAAEWLMCEDICVPGNAQLTLPLPIVAAAPAPEPTWGPRIRAVVAGLPRADASWTLSASRTAQAVTLSIRPARPGLPAPRKPHFFTADGLIAYDQPQVAAEDGQGGWKLTLPVASDGPADAKRLTGVLTTEGSWVAGGELRGLLVDAAFAPAAAARRSGGESGPAAPAAAAGLGGTLLLAFLGGLILNLMPCVFPVLGIKILGFVNQAGHQRGKVVAHGLVFTLGVLLSFWTLAGVLALLRASGDQLGWGFQLQSAGFVYALAVLLLVFALNLSGLFEFGLSATAVGGELQMKSGLTGSFFTGVLATVVATPCSAPFLAPALGAALAVSTVESFVIFTAIAVGLSGPYLFLSAFPQAVRVLPRPGAWMETFKQLMAFPLYATVGYLVWVLAAQTSEEGFRGVLLSLVAIALAAWCYGRWCTPGAKLGRRRFGLAAMVAAGVFGLWLGWPRDAAAEARDGAKVTWEAWSPEAVTRLRAEGRIIYVDFTARWCATCQTNKKLVFGSEEVRRHFAERKIATLRADWTNQDPRITAELARYQRSAVPFNLIWLPGQEAPVILPEVLTPALVLEALKKG